MHKRIIHVLLIGFSVGIMSLMAYACGTNTKSHNSIMTSNTYYPKDHKLTSQERKECSIKFLKTKGVPVIEHLPLIEDYTEAQFRNEKSVAAKAVILYGLVHVAQDEISSDEMIRYFKKYNLWGFVSPSEREYLAKRDKTQANIEISWRIENLNVLLWALGKANDLSFPTAMCDFSEYEDLPDLENDPSEWIENARLRNHEEILNESDLIYRIHWAVRDAGLKGKPMPADINRDVVMERHFALNWLTMYAEEWDEITTDT